MADTTGRLGLNSFISLIKNKGLSQANYFSAILYPPPKMSGHLDLTQFALLCDSASIPGVSLITNDVSVYGEARQMPTQRLFSEMTLSFYVDMDLIIKKYFDDWMDLVINPTSRTMNYYADYVSTMQIIVHDKNYNVKYQVTLHECFPKTINSINLDFNDRAPMKLSVGFEYKYYTVENQEKDQQNLQGFLSTSMATSGSKPNSGFIQSSLYDSGSPVYTLPSLNTPLATWLNQSKVASNPSVTVLPAVVSDLSTTITQLKNIRTT
jgi:hypothetical protein